MRVIAGSAGGIRLSTPEGMKTRPTIERIKEAIFSSVHFRLPGMRVLDLFAGTGDIINKSKFKNEKAIIKRKVALGNNISYVYLLSNNFSKAENFLENALKTISEIDILANDGIIITERSAEKPLTGDYAGLIRQKDRRYGTVCITAFEKHSVT